MQGRRGSGWGGVGWEGKGREAAQEGRQDWGQGAGWQGSANCPWHWGHSSVEREQGTAGPGRIVVPQLTAALSSPACLLLTCCCPLPRPSLPPAATHPPLPPLQGLQGGPHNHTISALAVALKMANTEEFRQYQAQVVANCAALCARMQALGYKVVSDGTDNHLILVDLKPAGIDGARVQTVLDEVSITLNKNSVPGDKSAMTPGGIRIGTPALTTRGFKEADFERVAEFIHRAIVIAKDCQASTPAPGKLKVGALACGHMRARARAHVWLLVVQGPVVGGLALALGHACSVGPALTGSYCHGVSLQAAASAAGSGSRHLTHTSRTQPGPGSSPVPFAPPPSPPPPPPSSPPPREQEFKEYLEKGEGSTRPDIPQLRSEVEALATSFPMPGL